MIEVSKLLIPECQHATETGHLSLGSGDSEQSIMYSHYNRANVGCEVGYICSSQIDIGSTKHDV